MFLDGGERVRYSEVDMEELHTRRAGGRLAGFS